MSALVPLLCAGLAAAAPAAPSGEADGGVQTVKPLGFRSRVQPEQVRLGEPFTYELIVTHTPGQRYEVRTPPDLGPFEVLQVERSRVDAQEQATTTFQVKMSLFELGKKTLPDFTFDVFEEGGTRRFVAPGLDMEALSSLPKDAETQGEALYDIKGLETVPVRSWRLLYALLATLAVAVLGYGLYRFLTRPRPQVVAQVPRLRLDVRTVKALDALREEDLPGQGRQREFFFRLSEILRGYLGERYRFEALECTSTELMDALRRQHTPGLKEAALRTFVRTSDWVKYARFPASPGECKEALEFGYQLVQTTFSPPAPAAPAAAHASGPDVS